MKGHLIAIAISALLAGLPAAAWAASPVVAATNTTNGTSAATNKVCNLPASISAGNMLVVMIRSTGADTHSLPTGWDAFMSGADNNGDDGSNDITSIFYKLSASGSEGATVTVNGTASLKFSCISYRITGHHTTANPYIAGPATGPTTTPDPPNLDPGIGSQDFLWLWLGGWEGEQTSPPAGNPTAYSNPIGADSGIAGAPAGNNRVAGAERALTASSEDPPSWTISASDNTSAWTVAVVTSSYTPPAGPPNQLPLRGAGK